MGWRDGAGESDAQMPAHPLPSNAVGQLEAWRAAAGACYAEGTGAHAVHYVPASWAGIRPWPGLLTGQTQQDEMALSRRQVREVAHACTRTSGWADALVTSYVWGQGRNGYGPHRLRRILERASARTVLSQAAETLADDGAVAAYRTLYGATPGLGPAFLTKFLYFAGTVLPHMPAPSLISA